MNLLRTSSQKRLFRCVIVYFLTFCMFFNASLPVVLAGPDGAVVVNGDVSIQQSGYNTTITASDKAIINYSSFDIARPEIVQFIQPDTSASVLNRILSANPTNINGTLLANGRVFFVNPAGVYFGNGAQVNVNQLVASALNITDADFINGRYNFVGGEGSVINEGDIFAEKVYLIGRQVANSGSISCPSGYVVMASGDRVFLGEPGSDIVLEIDGPSLPESADPIEGSGVLNEGTVEAAGGTIVLAAAGDIYSQAISNVGSLSVSAQTGDGGQIKLTTVEGDVTNTGTIDASGSEGGQITMEGTRVGQFGIIHADGTDSHGGSVDLTASDVVALSSDSLTTANAGLNGDGGDVVVYSPGAALFHEGAKIEGKGGSESGDGGFVEVSGKEYMFFQGHVDASAVVGENGVLLIDPASLEIKATGAGSPNWQDHSDGFYYDQDDQSILDPADIITELASQNVLLLADDLITVTDPIVYNQPQHLKLETTDSGSSIVVNDAITNNGAGDVTLDVGSNGWIDLNADISLNGGMLSGNASTVNVLSDNASIQNGIDVAATSATVTVSDGTYTEDLTVDKSNLTLKSVNGRDDTTIQLVDGVGIDIGSGGSSFTLGGAASDGFNIKSSVGATTFNIQLTSATSDVEISWNTIDTTGNASMGISVGAAGATGLTINQNNFIAEEGDGSIWGEVFGFDTTVSNNTFTGPGGLVSGYAIQFKAATGASSITGNNITGYGWGVGVLTGGGGTSGLTISDNSITNCVTGIGLAQYQAGDITTVDITGNTLSNNTTGVKIYDGAGVKASNFTIQGNSFTGNTTGLANNHASESVTAELNYWGSDNGPTHADNTFNVSSQGDTVTGNVDYVQWRQTSMSGPSFAPVENLMSGDLYASIQAGIDDASSDDDLRAEAGTFTENVHADDQIDVDFKVGDSVIDGSLTTEADCQISSSGSLRITGAVEAASDITASTGLTFENTVVADGGSTQTFDAGGGTLHALNTITKTGTGGLNLTANTLVDLDNTVDVQSAASDLVVTGTVVADGLLKATGNIDLKNGATLGGDVTSVGGDIDFRDTVSADGGSTQTFDAGGGTLHAWNTITKIGTGGLNLTANTLVDLDNTVDVQSAASDLVVTGTVVADGLLKATGNIDLKNGATLGGDVTSVGGNIDFRDTVSADGGSTQTFDAGGGTLHALNTITKTGTGGLNLTANTLVDLDNTVDVQSAASDLVVTGTVVADGLLKATGDIDLKNGATLGGDVTSVGGDIDFRDTVSADGGAAQTFDAGGGTLHALNTITKTGTGGLNLTANTLVDLDNTVDVQSAASDLVVTGTVVADGLLKATGNIDLKNGATLGGDVTSVGGDIDFRDTVSADGGSTQTFDAGGGTLHAWNTITKTGTGGLNLTANTLVDLDNTVDVQSAASDLVVTGTVVADGLLKATGDIDLKNGATLGGNVTSVGGDIDFRDTVSADGGDQVFDAEGGTLTTNNGISITKTTAGTLSLGGATALNLGGDVKATAAGGNLVFTDDVTASGAGSQGFDSEGGTLTAKSITKAAGDLTLGGATGIDLDGTVDVQGGNLNLEDNVTVADDEMLKASGNVTVAAGKTLTAEGHLGVEATGGAITAGLITMQADDKTLTLTQNDAIDMAAFSVTNSGNTDLVANSTDGSVTSSTADSWQSITAEAKDNIELSGTGDIKIAATGLLSHEGGVKVVSNSGSIYTPGAGDTLNAPITGYSDESADTGVDLIYPYWPELGTKAAIVIWSPNEDLKLGPDAILTANGTYDPTQFDDRLSFLLDFFTDIELRGDPVDVAIYLGSNYGGNVDMGSGSVWIDNKSLTEIGTLAIDAFDTVTFTDAFENSLPGSTVRRLEVISRTSAHLDDAIAFQRLPYADNPSLLADGLYLGTYVLRGRDLLFTQVLDKQEEAPIVPPKLEEPEEQGAVEEPDMEALIALLEELGIGVQPHLARAFRDEKSGINTLNTDLRLFKAAEKLQKLIPMLEDTEGRRIAALRVVVGQYFSTLASISDEQMATFRQELARHAGDETDYDLAGQTISSLTDYVEILSTDIGWPTDRSMAFVMGRYIPRLTEGDAIRTAVVQIRMQEALGI